MYIIFGDQIEEIKDRHILLQLDDFEIGNETKTAFCVITPDKIPPTELPETELNCRLHHVLVNALRRKDYDTAKRMIKTLRGKFGGEADSFYDEISKRIQEKNVVDGKPK